MEYELQRKTLESYNLVCDMVLTQEEIMESIVPDSFPDISRIISTNGTAFITAQSPENGSARLNGMIKLSVLYLPDDTAIPKSLSFSLPFQCTGVDTQIKETAHIQSVVLSLIADAQLLNPRKLLLKAEVKLHLFAYSCERISLPFDMAQTHTAMIEKQQSERLQHCIASATAKPFHFSEVLRLSASKPPMEEILSIHAYSGSLDARCIGTKLVCKGEVALVVLYRSSEDLIHAQFDLPFSQVLDINGGMEECEPEVLLALQDVNAVLSDGALEVTVDALLQAVLWSRRSLTILSDLYSTNVPLDVARIALELCTHSEHHIQHETGRQFCESGIPVKSVLSTQVYTGETTKECLSDGLARYCANVNISILYLSEDDALCNVEYTIPVCSEIKIPTGHSCTCRCHAKGEAIAVPVTGGLEVRPEVDFHITTTQYESLPYVASVTEGNAVTPPLRPSIIVRKACADETLWDIAKSCTASLKDICTVNELSENTDVAGMVLLIPVKRS